MYKRNNYLLIYSKTNKDFQYYKCLCTSLIINAIVKCPQKY